METKNAAVQVTENQRGKKFQELSVTVTKTYFITLSQVISIFEFK